MLEWLLKHEVVRFGIVGVFNTLMGVLTMFIFYHFWHLGYWGASGLSYFVCSVLSFFLNRSFTFKNNDNIWRAAALFAVNIGICYFAAYLLAKPLVIWLIGVAHLPISEALAEQGAMLFGMVLFTIFNYFGQKLVVFGGKSNG